MWITFWVKRATRYGAGFYFCGAVPPAAYFFLARQKNGAASGGHIFSLLREKIWKKRALERFYSASRLKALSFRSAFCRYIGRSPNTLWVAVQSGFPSARHAMQIVLFAPVEYLTYGIRKLSDFHTLNIYRAGTFL